MESLFFKGNKLNYFGRECTVIESNEKYVLIQFNSESKICTSKSSFLR